MTKDKAIELLDNLIGMVEDNHGSDYDKAIHMAIDALKVIDAFNEKDLLTDRPCAVCKYNEGNGCKKWECVFGI